MTIEAKIAILSISIGVGGTGVSFLIRAITGAVRQLVVAAQQFTKLSGAVEHLADRTEELSEQLTIIIGDAGRHADADRARFDDHEKRLLRIEEAHRLEARELAREAGE